jgi:SAM-dependent methyltransferase
MSLRSTQLNHWFNTPLGKRLLQQEVDALQQILPHLFGYHLLQIGNFGEGCLLESSRIMHRFILTTTPPVTHSAFSHVYAAVTTLPFASDSLDVVVLPHTLEFEENPHEILREVERILIPEGWVVILGFNPISFWGMWHWLRARYKPAAPWCGRFLPLLRLKDWLTLLDFEVKEQKTFFYALPFHNDRCKNFTIILEKMGAYWLNNFGAVYLIVAKKRVTTLTPIRPKWWLKKALVTGAVSTHFEDPR